MKNASVVIIGFLALMNTSFLAKERLVKEADLVGAWTSTASDGTIASWIITSDHFSIAYYKTNEFLYTEGGMWTLSSDNEILFTREYHTRNAELVGVKEAHKISLKEKKLSMENTEWNRTDNGTPGALAGAWLITGRYRDGELSERTPGARRTMKILSGTKFQWIAYNVDTKEFFGTGGGSYTTKNGKYTENIEFFSRDNSRVGASLEFDYKLENGKWRHSGFSSKGDPLDEVWTKRDVLGI